LYICETWSLTVSEEDRLKVFENSMPRRILDTRRGRQREVEKNWIKRSFITYNPRQFIRRSNQEDKLLFG
jgi:hypothetical protein